VTNDPNDLLGRQLGPYSIERLVGQGGFAWVFAGTRTTDGLPVALKVLKPRFGGDEQFEGRFRNESQIASQLHHPHIVRILEVGSTGGFTFFSMDYYPDSLTTLLRRGVLDPDALTRIAIQVADGLAFAHEAGVIHRDIKVDNILLTADGSAVISDFGIARAVSGYATATGVDMTIGTPQYISPEQAQGRTLDGRTDLYSLGVTLYRAATGQPPFQSADWFELARMHVEDRPTPPTTHRPDLNPRLERVILKCLAKHPDDRYPSAAALVDELRAIADRDRRTSSFGMPARTSRVAQPAAPSRGRRHSWLALLAAILLVALIAAAVVLLGG
jgi:serine/threonine-protein kinase